jgi:5-methylcytosine-specific restriction endonuclease McrA
MAITQNYQAYLNSDRWKAKRLKVLSRDKFKCQKCKKAQATQVHHLTYERIFNERMTDLMSVCARCHREIHGIKDKVKTKRKRLKIFGKVLARVIR